MRILEILNPLGWTDYELIDSGNGEKLERFGSYMMIRPDPRIIWNKTDASLWEKADASYIRSSQTEGHWIIRNQPPANWRISYKNLVFTLKPTEFKHTGVFPEQAVNWDWIQEVVGARKAKEDTKEIKILNLFAYTGGATLAATSAGAVVTHVDSAKGAIDWAHENFAASGFEGKPVRWIVEDAFKFITREAKRGNTYDGIIMDPPRFGHGNKGEIWKLEKDLPKLLQTCKTILSKTPLFVLLNAYTADLSPIAIGNAVTDLLAPNGNSTIHELTLQESSGKRLVPNGISVRWRV
jgi:23S rRNA (cytosine1962-C5)-methyltransferase